MREGHGMRRCDGVWHYEGRQFREMHEMFVFAKALLGR